MLTVYLDGEPYGDRTYWKDLNRCMYFAKTIRRQNYFPPDKKFNSPEEVLENRKNQHNSLANRKPKELGFMNVLQITTAKTRYMLTSYF